MGLLEALPVLPWHDMAACAQPGIDPDLFYPDDGGVDDIHEPVGDCSAALDICRNECPVRSECFAAAAQTFDYHGVAGGLSPTNLAYVFDTIAGQPDIDTAIEHIAVLVGNDITKLHGRMQGYAIGCRETCCMTAYETFVGTTYGEA